VRPYSLYVDQNKTFNKDVVSLTAFDGMEKFTFQKQEIWKIMWQVVCKRHFEHYDDVNVVKM